MSKACLKELLDTLYIIIIEEITLKDWLNNDLPESNLSLILQSGKMLWSLIFPHVMVLISLGVNGQGQILTKYKTQFFYINFEVLHVI